MAIDREKVVQTAVKLAEKKRYAQAIAEYQKLTRRDPNDARTLLKIGDLQLKMDAHAAAVETYERVGRHYIQEGFVSKALAVYLQIRDLLTRHMPELDARYERVMSMLAELYEQRGLTSDALATLDELATKLLRARRDEEAIEAFRRVVALDPSNPLPHLRLAEALGRAKLVDEAAAQFANAADLLLALGRPDDALKVLDRLMQMRVDPAAAKRAATIYLERGAPNDGLLALAKLQVCFQSDPRDLGTLALLARAFEQIGQVPKAVEVEKEMVRLAREQGKREVYLEVLAHLQRVAPNDEAVRALVHAATSARPPPPSSQPLSLIPVSSVQEVSLVPSASVSMGSSSIEVEDFEDLSEAPEVELHETDLPFGAERKSQPGSAAGVRVPTSVRVAEETRLATDESIDLEAHVRDAYAEALALRREGYIARATEIARITLEVVPDSVALRELLRDLLFDAGDREGAIGEMIVLAQLAIDAREIEQAASILRNALRVSPDDARAIDLLAHLAGAGHAPYLPSRPSLSPSRDALRRTASQPSSQYDTYDASQPLPSYDPEEVVPGERFANTAELRAARPSFIDNDEPFVDSEPGSRSGAAPPSVVGPLRPPSSRGRRPSEILATTRGFHGGDSIEEALDEVDFFASRGLFEDARSILLEQMTRVTGHPLLRARLREIEALMEGTTSASGAALADKPVRSLGFDELDVSQALDALDAFEPVQEARSHFDEGEQVDVEAVFAKFKEGIKAQVADSDSATHYDLGLAYKGMGLTEDAIRELITAARDPQRTFVCYWMVGQMEQERGAIDAAIAAFVRALETPNRSTEQEIALCYELGCVYETQRDDAKALFYLEWCERKDPFYRDVSERVRAIRPRVVQQRRISSLRPQMNDDDFDRVFDDILGGGKLP